MWNWIKDELAAPAGHHHWAPFGLAVLEIANATGATSRRSSKASPATSNDLVDDVWGGIETAFKDVLNGVIDVWNQLHFTLPKVDALGVHIGGDTIGVPHIPHMASGGIVTSPTLALIGENGPEAVVPLGRGAGGPAVHIQNAVFNQEADVELLMRKAGFLARAATL